MIFSSHDVLVDLAAGRDAGANQRDAYRDCRTCSGQNLQFPGMRLLLLLLHE